ncbi:MAG: carbohydrate kinase [Bradyrhizobium sp.]|nr:carbohydrate kinase [Bradyrhizobium sp.]
MILSCGDALIDFVPVMAADGREAVRPAVGGSCLNVAVGVARLGAPTGFVGGLSTDLFGRMIADHAIAAGVDITPAARSDRQTTLAFVRIVGGESQYAFYDAATAAREWTFSRDSIPLDGVEALHVGSTTLVHDQGAAETLALIAAAKPRATIAFDPNCRPNLVKDRGAYRARIDAFAGGADIIKMSDVDFDYLYGEAAYAAKASALLSRGPSLIVITCGNKGAQAWHQSAGMIEVLAPKVEVVDTIGAGDSFQAALLFALRELGCIERSKLQAASGDELRRALSFACACAAVTCTRAGADPPWQREVTELYGRLRSS